MVNETTVKGQDWTATISKDTVSIGPSIELTEVTVVVEGTADVVPSLIEALAQKVMRAGG